MKTKEVIKFLWQAVDESDEMALSEAEFRFFTTVHVALMAYEDEVQLGHPVQERRCMICGVPVSRCCC